jgi:hypothetical protein
LPWCDRIALVIRPGSIDKDFHVRSVDLARLLKVNENDISRLVRSGVITRVSDPSKKKAFLYPCFQSVTRFVEFRFGQRETINQEFLTEKAGRERAQRLSIEMSNRERAGELVDKRKLIVRLTPIIVACRESLLSRAPRLERELTRTKGRKQRVAKLRAADLEALQVLSDLFKTLGESDPAKNGA